QGGASDRAEGTDARRGLRVLDAQFLRSGRGRRERHAEARQPSDRRPRSRAGGEPQEITSTDLHTNLPARRVGRVRQAYGWMLFDGYRRALARTQPPHATLAPPRR